LLCPSCSPSQPLTYPLSVNAQKVLRLLQSSDYTSAIRLKIDSGLANELERVMSSYLKYLLEKEVKSASWLETLREQKAKLQH
jgi:DNA repair protein RecO (recombination protein O)